MGDKILLVWSVVAFVTFATVAVLGYRASRGLTALVDVPPWQGPHFPRISVVVAARDEARNIEQAARSLLALDWPDLEIVMVDDRSSDGTGEIMDRLAAADARLKVVHVTELPPGWLGKNHALQLGADAATGGWILFTDGDVLFHPETLRQAVAHANARQLDHLTVGPEAPVSGLLLQAAIAGFGVFFSVFTRAWKLRDPGSSAHIGVGAFNLVRRAAYLRAGGHSALPLRPDDDLKLGKRLKQTGCAQEIAMGRGRLSVEWYGSLREMARGLEKNAFASMEYSVPATVVAVLAVLTLFAFPLVGLVISDGAARVLFTATYVLQALATAESARRLGLDPWLGPMFPFSAVFLAYVVVRSMVVTLRTGGIRWRGTFYPLAELRRNRV
ncbi:MAG TPA: glycosyltransferase family 2 protein [Candidatus Polarisedimenticolaceae bacterium]|nr:glycosyltransferase family 2 protein [Candidatus Polarisedimenticolaceae bacterium]